VAVAGGLIDERPGLSVPAHDLRAVHVEREQRTGGKLAKARLAFQGLDRLA